MARLAVRHGRAVDSVASYFDRQAMVWRDMYTDLGGVYATIQRQRQAWALRTIGELHLPPGTPVLEVGIGSGTLAVSLAGQGIETVGVDLSPSMLKLSQQAARTEGVGGQVKAVLADACCLPFRDHAFEVAIAIGVIPWVADPDALIVELSRVTAPSGHVVVTADNSNRLTYALDPRLNPRLARPRRTVGALLRRDPVRGAIASGLSRAEFHRMLTRSRLEVLSAYSLGFGPFTFLGRQVMSDRLSHRVNDLLQKGADRGITGLQIASCQHLVLARLPA